MSKDEKNRSDFSQAYQEQEREIAAQSSELTDEFLSEEQKAVLKAIEKFEFTPGHLEWLIPEISGDKEVFDDWNYDLFGVLAGFSPDDLSPCERSRIVSFLRLCAGDRELLEYLH